MAAARKRNVRSEKQPKRKVGRYLLVFLVSIPLFAQLRHVDVGLDSFAFELPKMSLEKEVKFTNVVIEGELVYSDKNVLKAQLIEQLQSDFVRLNLSDIQNTLLENNWYRSVSVNREWPSTLKVSIQEQQPIARWGTTGFINRYGEVVLHDDISVLDHLPLLEGADEHAYEIAKSYLTMGQLMIDHQLYITKLSVSDAGTWWLEVNHDFLIQLGDRNLSERIERFLFLYGQQLVSRQNELAHVDMRYLSGVAVEWKKQMREASVLDESHENIASR